MADITIDGPDGSFGAYLAVPASTPAPGIVVAHDAPLGVGLGVIDGPAEGRRRRAADPPAGPRHRRQFHSTD